MTRPLLFPGFDGLLTLSRREGVDIRPTLLRVLTDLYVQASAHSTDEARQFIELTSRLIDDVDDATRAAVRARLAVYPGTPVEVLRKLGMRPVDPDLPVPLAEEIAAASPAPASPCAADVPARMSNHLSMQPRDAAEIHELFFRASGSERVSILHSLADTPLKAAPRIPDKLTKRAIETLEMAAFAADVENFKLEVSESLILPTRLAAEIVDDTGGEPLAVAMRALAMPSPVYQRVLLFLKAEIGGSVHMVYRLSRLYDRVSERSALIMLAAWRGANTATMRAKFRPTLYDDERQRARNAGNTTRSTVQPGSSPPVRTGTNGS
ncbi:DUF2336 domain-containing protein [Bradyrhizobium sp. Tv2a-2]|uniref:DUF2336 domain-containing protein n=1 Tax=Bradyrhizobium sp. Tv2a-2 TaxID=113395 RepID=UPI0003F5282D|nr:DUF2336 domain-containing protein [Bradyrhizobium sp. Tv2a-2]